MHCDVIDYPGYLATPHHSIHPFNGYKNEGTLWLDTKTPEVISHNDQDGALTPPGVRYGRGWLRLHHGGNVQHLECHVQLGCPQAPHC